MSLSETETLSYEIFNSIELLEGLEVQYKHGKKIKAGEHLYINMLAVSPKYQRKKILKQASYSNLTLHYL